MWSNARSLSGQQLLRAFREADALALARPQPFGASPTGCLASEFELRTNSHKTASTSMPVRTGRGLGVSDDWSILAAFSPASRSRPAAQLQYEARRFCRWLKESAPLPTAPQSQHGGSGSTSLPVISADVLPSRHFEVRMEAQLVFEACWRKFEEKYKLKAIHVPREVVWLNGAPGSGKGANTRHILSTRGLDHSICLSTQLLAHPDAHAHVERGDMIPDALVGDVLLEQLLIHSCSSADCGVLVDGFPRTAHQVDFLKLLSDKLGELHQIFSGTAQRDQFPRPLFKVVMLYVDEETAIQRQLERARIASVVNKRIVDACAGELREQRTTDLSIEICRKRYAIFRTHYHAIMRLKQFFPFHLIDAMGSLNETQEAITTELRYQSSLDLSEYTYSAIRHLPLARDLADHARQQLVQRLDTHADKHDEVFLKVIEIITAEIMPVLHESGLAGHADYVSEARMFSDHPRSTQVLIDVLTDRGFCVSHTSEVSHVPTQFDQATGLIRCRRDVRHRFHISWEIRNVRDKAMEMAAGMAEVSVKNVRISQSFIPSHFASRDGSSTGAKAGSSGTHGLHDQQDTGGGASAGGRHTAGTSVNGSAWSGAGQGTAQAGQAGRELSRQRSWPLRRHHGAPGAAQQHQHHHGSVSEPYSGEFEDVIYGS